MRKSSLVAAATDGQGSLVYMKAWSSLRNNSIGSIIRLSKSNNCKQETRNATMKQCYTGNSGEGIAMSVEAYPTLAPHIKAKHFLCLAQPIRVSTRTIPVCRNALLSVIVTQKKNKW